MTRPSDAHPESRRGRPKRAIVRGAAANSPCTDAGKVGQFGIDLAPQDGYLSKRLRAELARVTMERDILGKATI